MLLSKVEEADVELHVGVQASLTDTGPVSQPLEQKSALAEALYLP